MIIDQEMHRGHTPHTRHRDNRGHTLHTPDRENRRNTSHTSDRGNREWAEWLEREYPESLFNLYLITLMFNPLAGNSSAIIEQMNTETGLFYDKLITRVHRNPHNVLHLPLLIMHPDLPVPKRKKSLLEGTAINGGLHLHGIIAIPLNARFGTDFVSHVASKLKLYKGHAEKIRVIHIEPITRTPEVVVNYIFKSLDRKTIDIGYTFIRPLSKSELRPKKSPQSRRA